MLSETKVQNYPQYIKQMTWELGLDMVAFAERLDPRNFPSGDSVSAWIDGAIKMLQAVRDLQDQRGSGGLRVPDGIAAEQQQLVTIMRGIRIAWSAHHTQRELDRRISDPDERL